MKNIKRYVLEITNYTTGNEELVYVNGTSKKDVVNYIKTIKNCKIHNVEKVKR